jgi:hypothetical protein
LRFHQELNDFLFTISYEGDQIKESEMDGVCDRHVRREMYAGFCGMKKERPRGRPRPGCEDDMKTDLEGSKLRVCILESSYSGHKWLVLVNIVASLQIP